MCVLDKMQINVNETKYVSVCFEDFDLEFDPNIIFRARARQVVIYCEVIGKEASFMYFGTVFLNHFQIFFGKK